MSSSVGLKAKVTGTKICSAGNRSMSPVKKRSCTKSAVGGKAVGVTPYKSQSSTITTQLINPRPRTIGSVKSHSTLPTAHSTRHKAVNSLSTNPHSILPINLIDLTVCSKSS